jgi:hypothetical protein
VGAEKADERRGHDPNHAPFAPLRVTSYRYLPPARLPAYTAAVSRAGSIRTALTLKAAMRA